MPRGLQAPEQPVNLTSLHDWEATVGNSRSWLVALCGLITSLATAIAVTLIDHLTGFNAFTLSVFVVVPAGAGLCGFAAASGYYLGAKYLHEKPSKWLLLQMVAVAAFTQIFIYYLEYITLEVDGQNISEYVGFVQYIDVSLTSSHMRIGRGAGVDTGEVGSFGYWLAAFEFVGFMIGGVFVYFQLKDTPACGNCEKYLRTAINKEDSFADIEEFAEYYDNVYANPVDSLEFQSHVCREFSAGKVDNGAINLNTRILECPKCLGQWVRETVQILRGGDWKDVNELQRFVKIPDGVDVRKSFIV